MKIYIQRFPHLAMKWIFNGYAHAWAYLDHKVIFINDLNEIKDNEDYKIFCYEMMINEHNLHKLENSVNSYVFVQPNEFPQPWGSHRAYITCLSDSLIYRLNQLRNIIKWTFGDALKHFYKWENVHVLPLAFDSINYTSEINLDFKYDICFVGASVDNGLGEKVPIINEVLNTFVNSGLNCGFSVGQNISHELENQVLIKSKVCLNIHDAYQRALGYDSNERTFKSLGVNGLLVCDEVHQVKSLFPDCYLSNNSKDLVEKTKYYCSLPKEELISIKEKNINLVNNNHTYIKRVEEFLNIS